MAEKVTDQTELAETPATGDLIHIVDVSDTTDDAAGSSKKITIGNLMGSNVVTTTVREPIQTITNATAGEFDFDNIPQDGGRLIIEGFIQTDQATIADEVYMFVNSDLTTTNYHAQITHSADGGAGDNEFAYPFVGYVGGTTADRETHIRISLEEYAATGKKVSLFDMNNPRATTHLSHLSGMWYHHGDTAAISRVRLRADNHPTGGITGELTLYREREATVGGVTYPGDRGTLTTVKTPVATVTNTTAGAFDITGIPAGGKRLVIQGYIRSDATTTNDISHIYLNGNETLTNYYTRQFYNASTNGAVSNEPRCAASISGASSVTDAYTRFTTVIEDYDSSYPKMISTEFFAPNNTTDVRAGHAYVISTISDPVTQITVKADGDPTDQLFGEVTVYVEKDVVFSPGKHEIETIENITAGKFDFQNVPTGFKRLIIQGKIEGDVTAQVDDVYCFFNNDTTAANYYHGLSYSLDTTAPAAEGATPRIWQVNGATAVGRGAVEMVIEGYDDSSLKSARGFSDQYRSAGAQISTARSSVYHDSMTAAINRITIQADGDPTDQLIGKLTLYGEM